MLGTGGQKIPSRLRSISSLRIELTFEGVKLLKAPTDLVSLDVEFGGQRIWSFTIGPDESGLFLWPAQLELRLTGYARVEVRDSTTGSIYADDVLFFDDRDEEFRLRDADGRPLMLNKWLRLAPMLADGAATDKRDDLVALLAATRDKLLSLGYQVFAVGGTALGPYREGDLLPHDDDGDLAVFFDFEEPVDIARGMIKLQRQLRRDGYRVRPHSHAHLQVYPPYEGVDSKLYIDVFAAFMKDGMINQPFHVRGPFKRDQLLPFASVQVRGEKFAVPADTNAWLATNYDENWRTPQPGFLITTPTSTKRRFRSWFGSYNLHRHFWEMHAAEYSDTKDYLRTEPDPAPYTLASGTIVNLGSGSNPRLPDSLNLGHERPVIHALDYADTVRNRASKASKSEADFDVRVSDVNFTNYQAVLSFVASLPPEPFDLYCGFVIEGQDQPRRKDSFWRFARMAILSGGDVVIDHLDTLGSDYSRTDPRSWHLDFQKLENECATERLNAEKLGSGNVVVNGEARSYTRTRIVLEEASQSVIQPTTVKGDAR